MKPKIRFKYKNFEVYYADFLAEKLVELGYEKNDMHRIIRQLAVYILSDPPKLKGDRIPQTGGAIKVRIAPRNSTKGSRSEDRLIYCFLNGRQFFFLAIYPKSAKENLSTQETQALSHVIKEIKRVFSEKGNDDHD
jgi:hypothetical protein